MLYRVQMVSANDLNRNDNSKSAKWETVASGTTAEVALLDLMASLNSEDIIVNNFWLRLVKPNGEIVNC